jgi:hypothetical protein
MAFPRLTVVTLPSRYPCILALGDPVEAGHVLDFARFNGVRQSWLPAVLFRSIRCRRAATAVFFNDGGLYLQAPAKF